MNFESWLEAIDSLLAQSGLQCSELPDQPYRDLYDNKASPYEVANRILEGIENE